MDNKRSVLVIGSRESALAVRQSEIVMEYLRTACPELEITLKTMKTTGDRILERRLDEIGGKGLFVKELDQALRDGRTDLSVHSLKDMPMETPADLPVIGFSRRADPRDVLVLPAGAGAGQPVDFSKPIGTSSRRRILQLQKLFPQARFESVRGNVQTRLRKLDEGQYGAIILAAAGLKRAGLGHRISRYFSVEEVIPSAGQGILALQGRAGEDYACLDGFLSRSSAMAAAAERAFVRALGGGCTSPIAAHAEWVNTEMDEGMNLRGFYYDEEACRGIYKSMQKKVCTLEDCRKLGEALAEDVLKDVCKVEATMTGKVWLVGAGPGDRGLFTLKGLEVLQNADVVVYDALVGDEILTLIPAAARKINVGKRAGNHLMAQEDINRTLLEEAQKGQKVVRLKGGDPFLFGRGGEELELLSENGIPYEVVPGVTSAFAVPAYNGIPVTHRDFTSSVHIITGHRRAGCRSGDGIDYDALVRTRGTLVFLMGVSSLSSIMEGLLGAGMSPDMPAAVLERGTTAGQRRVVATVAALKEEADRAQIQAPAIIVVGQVCRLADTFSWYEKRPLAGKKILVTRPREHISEMSARLRRLGAEVLEIPAIETVPIRPNPALEEAMRRFSAWSTETSGPLPLPHPAAEGNCGQAAQPVPMTCGGYTSGSTETVDIVRENAENVRTAAEADRKTAGTGCGKTAGVPATCPDWLIFTSPTGVRVFMDKFLETCDVRTLRGTRIAAIGEGSSRELRKYGLRADFLPSVYDGETLGRELAGKIRGEGRPACILIPRAAIGGRELIQELEKAGNVEVLDIPTYETAYASPDLVDEREQIRNGDIDYAVFTSASTVRGFAAAMEGVDLTAVRAICIGRQTRAAADACGMQTRMAARATLDALTDAVVQAACDKGTGTVSH